MITMKPESKTINLVALRRKVEDMKFMIDRLNEEIEMACREGLSVEIYVEDSIRLYGDREKAIPQVDSHFFVEIKF